MSGKIPTTPPKPAPGPGQGQGNTEQGKPAGGGGIPTHPNRPGLGKPGKG